MSACYTSNLAPAADDLPDHPEASHHIIVALGDELLAAVEGWRQVHGVEQSDAIGTLVRLGLLSEIAKIYRFVASPRPASSTGPALARRKRQAAVQSAADRPWVDGR